MEKNRKIVILIIIFSLSFSIRGYGADVTKINELVENSLKLDNTEVIVQGELIGEALERGENAWININDGTNAIGVWVKRSDISQFQYYGDYKHKGDIVEITGVFYKACAEHGGDTDVHCSNIELVEKGYDVKRELSYIKVMVSILLVAVTALILTLYFNLMKNQI